VKKLFSISVPLMILVLTISAFGPMVTTKNNGMIIQTGVTLADVIHQGISSINWSQDDPWESRACLTHFGQIFCELPLSAYDRDVQTQVNSGNWVQALQGIRMAEIDGYRSSVIDNCTRQVLDNHPMAGTLPANYPGDLFLVYYRFEINGYKYAERLGYALSKWNKSQACSDFAKIFENCTSFIWSCDSSELVTGDDRYYDGSAQTLDVFLKFYEIGVPEAIAYADDVWNRINNYSWLGYYPYHLGGLYDGMVECEVCFHTIIGEYAEEKNNSIPYYDRLLQDINYKLLVDGWNSSLWYPEGYCITHAGFYSEKRLGNTLSAFQVLQSYYPQFNDTMKDTLIQLLTGSTPAWEGLVFQSGLCDTTSYRFKGTAYNPWTVNPPHPSVTDTCTAIGDWLLFLDGIVPSTGSLAIPELDEVYEDVCSSFSFQNFSFNYDTKTIRIPVNAGELKFQFGTTLVPYTFPNNGVYEVTFSNDWNSIVKVRETKYSSNVNRVVNILSGIVFASAFGSNSNESNWDVRVDFDSDNRIDILDAIIFANKFMVRV
jgi:hypothetical protein